MLPQSKPSALVQEASGFAKGLDCGRFSTAFDGATARVFSRWTKMLAGVKSISSSETDWPLLELANIGSGL